MTTKTTANTIPFEARMKEVRMMGMSLLNDRSFTVAKAQELLTEAGTAFDKNLRREQLIQLLVMVAEDLHLAKIRETYLAGQDAELQRRAKQRIEFERGVIASQESVKRSVNGPEKDMLEKVEESKQLYFKNIGLPEIVVSGFQFHKGQVDRFGRTTVGYVAIRVPADILQIKVWDKDFVREDGRLGAFVWKDASGYSVDARARYKAPNIDDKGDGLYVLPVRLDKNNKVSVRLPVSKDRKTEGVFWNNFRAADRRFEDKKGDPLFLDDNTQTVNAAITAFVRAIFQEQVVANPSNRGGFKANCGTCANAVRLATRDGVDDDVNMSSPRSRAVLEQPDVMQLAQVGPYQPRLVCGITEQFVDIEVTHTANQVTKQENEPIFEDGRYKYPGKGEAVIGGKIENLNEWMENATESICSGCPFYVPAYEKSNSRYNKEKEENGGRYVSRFYRGMTYPENVAIQTLINNEWVMGAPGEFEEPDAFRIKTAGFAVTGTDEVMEAITPMTVEEEAFDAELSVFNKMISQFYHAAFNFESLSKEQLDIVIANAQAKPENLADWQSRSWDKAVESMKKGIQWALERMEREEERDTKEEFAKHFYGTKRAGEAVGAYPIDIETIVGDTIIKSEEGILGFGQGHRDLTPAEFSKYVQEMGLELIWDVLEYGHSFYITGGKLFDRELVAASLQHELQRQVDQLFSGVQFEENKEEALQKMRITDEAKAYLASRLERLQ